MMPAPPPPCFPCAQYDHHHKKRFLESKVTPGPLILVDSVKPVTKMPCQIAQISKIRPLGHKIKILLVSHSPPLSPPPNRPCLPGHAARVARRRAAARAAADGQGDGQTHQGRGARGCALWGGEEHLEGFEQRQPAKKLAKITTSSADGGS